MAPTQGQMCYIGFYCPVLSCASSHISRQKEQYIVEEPGFKNVKNKHLGMPPF